MNIFVKQFNYRSRYLVVVDGDINVYKYETYKFDQPFLIFQPKFFLLVNQKFVK